LTSRIFASLASFVNIAALIVEKKRISMGNLAFLLHDSWDAALASLPPSPKSTPAHGVCPQSFTPIPYAGENPASEGLAHPACANMAPVSPPAGLENTFFATPSRIPSLRPMPMAHAASLAAAGEPHASTATNLTLYPNPLLSPSTLSPFIPETPSDESR
jgi:hypothetical protein